MHYESPAFIYVFIMMISPCNLQLSEDVTETSHKNNKKSTAKHQQPAYRAGVSNDKIRYSTAREPQATILQELVHK